MTVTDVRQAIRNIARGYYSRDDEQCLIRFVAWEIYGLLNPSGDQPGALFAWLVKHGYSDQAIRSMLFQYQTDDGIPGVIVGWAIQIVHALIAPNSGEYSCNCAELAHSHKAQIEARKRCVSHHHLSRPNLDEFAASAPGRVRVQFGRQHKNPTADEEGRAIDWHSDPVTYVCRAVHGNSKNLALSEGQGTRSFGHSMFCAVFSTPLGSQLRLKRWKKKGKKKEYVLYDTRDGIVREWKLKTLRCLTCNISVTDPRYSPCPHPLYREVHIGNEPPANTCDVDVAKCNGACVGKDGLRTIWLWNDKQKQCPVCGSGRRHVTIKTLVSAVGEQEQEHQDDEYRKKQMDEPIPYDWGVELED